MEMSFRRSLINGPGIYYDANHDIIGYRGLTFVEMPHKIELVNKVLFGGCAWDTLFIPQLLEEDVTIRSTDHVTNEKEKWIETGMWFQVSDDIHVSLRRVNEEEIQE